MDLSDEGRALLADLARDRVRPGSDGWIPHIPHYKSLVWLGLVEERSQPEFGFDLELRLTDAGWQEVSHER